MKVAKRFRWEAAHRLPWHQGGCENLHGHSYYMMVEVEGEPDDRGMLIDFKEIKRLLKPLVDAWDHAVLVADDDTALLQAIDILNSKHFILPFDSTSENLCTFVLDHLGRQGYEILKQHRVTTLRVRVQETETCYAEQESRVSAYAGAAALSNEVHATV